MKDSTDSQEDSLPRGGASFYRGRNSSIQEQRCLKTQRPRPIRFSRTDRIFESVRKDVSLWSKVVSISRHWNYLCYLSSICSRITRTTLLTIHRPRPISITYYTIRSPDSHRSYNKHPERLTERFMIQEISQREQQGIKQVSTERKIKREATEKDRRDKLSSWTVVIENVTIDINR